MNEDFFCLILSPTICATLGSPSSVADKIWNQYIVVSISLSSLPYVCSCVLNGACVIMLAI